MALLLRFQHLSRCPTELLVYFPKGTVLRFQVWGQASLPPELFRLEKGQKGAPTKAFWKIILLKILDYYPITHYCSLYLLTPSLEPFRGSPRKTWAYLWYLGFHFFLDFAVNPIPWTSYLLQNFWSSDDTCSGLWTVILLLNMLPPLPIFLVT